MYIKRVYYLHKPYIQFGNLIATFKHISKATFFFSCEKGTIYRIIKYKVMENVI